MLVWVALTACWLAVLLRASPAWWRALNRGGADVGRGVAWFCSGGLGWKLARVQIDQARRADAMAKLQLDLATWRAERSAAYRQAESRDARGRWR